MGWLGSLKFLSQATVGGESGADAVVSSTRSSQSAFEARSGIIVLDILFD